jgi:LmbE family N-acetylglucosaminyl deacetylase
VQELEVYSDIPQSAMVIVAHPDDAEFLCAGTVARWTRGGAEVTYVLVTSGDKGSSDPEVDSVQLAATRRQEQEAATRVAGGARTVFLGYEDGMVEPTLQLRRDLSRQIRQWRPKAVICQDPTMFFGGRGYINHPDHRAVAEAAVTAIYPAARDHLTFPELAAAGFAPHKVEEVFLAGAERPDVIVDISETLPVKIEALQAHRSQVGHWNPAEMIGKWARDAAQGHPFEFGETFRYLKLE